MAEASWLITSGKKKKKDFFKTPAEDEYPGAIAPDAGMKKGLCKRETHHSLKQATKTGRGGGFLNPTQEVWWWWGLWAYRVLCHLKTFEAEAAT